MLHPDSAKYTLFDYRLAEILQVSSIAMEGELTMQAAKRGEIKDALKICRYTTCTYKC